MQPEDEYSRSWDLLNHCIEYLEENAEKWKKLKEERKRHLERQERLEICAAKSKKAKISPEEDHGQYGDVTSE